VAEVPDRIALEATIARALEIARARCGRTQEEMVRALSPYQSRPARHQQRWHDWINRPRSVSSVALLAAARMAGLTLDALLGEAMGASGQVAGAGDRPSQYDDQLAQVAAVVARLSETVETQGDLLDRIAREVLPNKSRSRQPEAADTR
jgi:hypothetical protein